MVRSVSALGPSWAILGHMGRSGAILGYLGQMTHLGPCWPIPLILDPSCSILSPSWFLSGAPSVNSFLLMLTALGQLLRESCLGIAEGNPI